MKWILSLFWIGALLDSGATNRPYVHPFKLVTCNQTESQEMDPEATFLPRLIGVEGPSPVNGSSGRWQGDEEEEEEERDPSPSEVRFVSHLQRSLAGGWFRNWSPLEGPGVSLLCPMHLHGDLAALSLGAGGSTAHTLQNILGFGTKGCQHGRRSRDRHWHFAVLNRKILTQQGRSLSTGAWLVFQKGLRLQLAFSQKLQQFHPTVQLRAVDFSQPHLAEESINSLIRNATAGMVGNLVSGLDRSTTLVFTSYIHFKGKWKTRSQCHGTEFQDFFNEGGRKVQVPMISLCGRFQYKTIPEYTLIKLPMSGTMYMVLVQPVRPNMMKNIESTLPVNSILNKLQSGFARVVLPRFQWDGTYDVKEFFRRMQELDVLGGKANYSRFSDDQQLTVDQVMQNVIFEVTEDGEEPTPTGDVPFRNTTVVTEIRIDKPFFFRVYDGTLDVLLFLGRVKKL
ncbi:angiotensinogen [Heptranchias perlo]|uniref:angiotensinogen n=1 Tax=Heptranchias perlo TaxID=212740 RepID=UPI00355A0275